MNLIKSLRHARESPGVALQEFLSKYNPGERRVHVFVEGQEDKVFYRVNFERFVPAGYKVFAYGCGNKDGVYAVYSGIRQRSLSRKDVYWCVDKDLSEFINEHQENDAALFVTDSYSIENYFVTATVVEYVIATFCRARGVAIDDKAILEAFENGLLLFYNKLLGIMSWIICARRDGHRPNLRNVNVGELCEVTDALSLQSKHHRADYLQRAASFTPCSWRQIRNTAQELRTLDPKCYVRGKFELWFLVAFLKRLRVALDEAAKREGGSVLWAPAIEASNAIAVLAPVVATPTALRCFLVRHYPQQPTL
jgi:hypothetical protein